SDLVRNANCQPLARNTQARALSKRELCAVRRGNSRPSQTLVDRRDGEPPTLQGFSGSAARGGKFRNSASGSRRGATESRNQYLRTQVDDHYHFKIFLSALAGADIRTALLGVWRKPAQSLRHHHGQRAVPG